MKRRDRILPAATERTVGDHVCWTYSSGAEHRRVLTSFLREGVVDGQRIAYLGVDGSEARVRVHLQESGLDVDSLIDSGALLLGDARASYVYDDAGAFDADETLGGFRTLAEGSIDDGFSGFRVAAENGWVLEDPSAQEAWALYELRAGLLIAELPIIGLCAFDARIAAPEALEVIAGVHSLTLNMTTEDSEFHLHSPAAGTVALEGELDIAWADRTSGLLVGAVDEVHEGTLDVSGLRFADVAGMRAVAAFVAAIERRGGVPMVRGASPTFRRIWALLGYEDALSVVFS